MSGRCAKDGSRIENWKRLLAQLGETKSQCQLQSSSLSLSLSTSADGHSTWVEMSHVVHKNITCHTSHHTSSMTQRYTNRDGKEGIVSSGNMTLTLLLARQVVTCATPPSSSSFSSHRVSVPSVSIVCDFSDLTVVVGLRISTWLSQPRACEGRICQIQNEEAIVSCDSRVRCHSVKEHTLHG